MLYTSRRGFLVAAGVSIVAAPHQFITDVSAATKLPNRKQFQSGDFLWPKTPGTFIPYSTQFLKNEEVQREKWKAEKKQFLAGDLKNKKHLTSDDKNRFQNMDYDEFSKIYFEDGSNHSNYQGRIKGLGVGHVAIVQLKDNGEPWIIEAILKGDQKSSKESGVITMSYDNWIENRKGQVVWHGRIREYDAKQRLKIAKEALKFVGKPYDFWNFDLSDSNGFYCSKLVWLSTFNALNIPIDGNPNPQRNIWFSPKQLLYTPKVARISDPGSYAYR